MKILWIVLCLIFTQSEVLATDYQVSIYLNEIRAGYKPTYTSTITFMDVAGRVTKTSKGVFIAPVISLPNTSKTCKTVSLKELDPPELKGFVVVCNGATSITVPEYLQVIGEPK